ncbi:MAG TPA: phytanoyl-CoA dioxygenase family protein [Rhizomicrobium sp.]|jgi:hypothetical protein|nr:phytanoyl-CoA dioxygenase family protein [Rhizomicrobium sp.]
MTLMTNSFAAGVQSLPRLDARTTDFDTALDLLKSEGVLVLEHAIDAAALADLRKELAPWFNRAHCGTGPFFGRQTLRFGGLFAKARSTAQLAIHPLVLPLMEFALKGDPSSPTCDAIELNLTQGIGIGPGEPPQFLHRDEDIWPFPNTFEIMSNAMWAIDDFTEENGATRLIPGSHKWSRDRHPEPGEALPAVAPAGSVVLWLGGTLHGGGANRSDAVRRGVVMSYRLGWLAPSEKLLLSIPAEVARDLPVRLQKLIGYQIQRPNLGWVEGHDPIEWLHGKIGQLAPMSDNLSPAQEALLDDVNAAPEKYVGYLA